MPKTNAEVKAKKEKPTAKDAPKSLGPNTNDRDDRSRQILAAVASELQDSASFINMITKKHNVIAKLFQELTENVNKS